MRKAYLVIAAVLLAIGSGSSAAFAQQDNSGDNDNNRAQTQRDDGGTQDNTNEDSDSGKLGLLGLLGLAGLAGLFRNRDDDRRRNVVTYGARSGTSSSYGSGQTAGVSGGEGNVSSGTGTHTRT